MFDEEQRDEHDECRHYIHELEEQVKRLRADLDHAVRDEREACAKILEFAAHEIEVGDLLPVATETTLRDYAKAIRARGGEDAK